MRVLIAHNYYQQPGGEDQVAAAEARLLAEHGHEVVWFRRHNDDVRKNSFVGLAVKTVWSWNSYTELRELLRRTRPDVCHFHNTFPLMSPAAFYAARAENVPTVMTVHNYRLLCPGATMMRDGKICRECLHKTAAWPAVVHGCYRQSRLATAVTAGMLAAHKMVGTWARAIDLYIAPTAFTRQTLMEGGFRGEKIAVKPNFLQTDPGYATDRSRTALFVGRLAPEKGIDVLLEAWRRLTVPMTLRIAGDGPLAGRVAEAARRDPRIEWLGPVPHEAAIAEMKKALVLVFPSTWYEVMPLTLIEAGATGLPALASPLGAIGELVRHGETGLHAMAGDGADFARQAAWCWDNAGALTEMGVRARREYERNYTAAANYRQLIDLYEQVRDAAHVGETAWAPAATV